ncbi:MAG: RQC domain-containing protein, partial [Candidatus Woesearchaeota archaeon]
MEKKEQKQIALIILQTINNLQAGKDKVASFLRGSHSKKNKSLRFKPGYGALLWCDLLTIKGFIEQLKEMEFIKQYQVEREFYSYPILTLTKAGEKALEEKMEIPLQKRREIKLIKIGESERT